MPSLLKSSSLLVLLAILSCSPKKSEPSAFDMLLTEGYEVFYSDTLKTDQKEFVIAALKNTDEDSLMYASNATVTRPLLILEKRSAGDFDIALRNDNAILCANCGGVFGNPLDAIEVSDKSIKVMHYGGSRYRWTRHVTFEFNEQNNWVLISDKGITIDTFEPEGEQENRIYTEIDPAQPIAFEAFNIYQ